MKLALTALFAFVATMIMTSVSAFGASEANLQVKVSCTEISAYENESPAVAQIKPVTLLPGQVMSVDQFFNSADRQIVLSFIDESYLNGEDGRLTHMSDVGYYVIAVNRLSLDNAVDHQQDGCDYHVSGAFSRSSAVVFNKTTGALDHTPAELEINYEMKPEQASCKKQVVNVTCALNWLVVR